jgi:hypothetical protein
MSQPRNNLEALQRQVPLPLPPSQQQQRQKSSYFTPVGVI